MAKRKCLEGCDAELKPYHNSDVDITPGYRVITPQENAVMCGFCNQIYINNELIDMSQIEFRSSCAMETFGEKR